MNDFETRLNLVKTRISNTALQCKRDPASIQLVCVSKTHPVESLSSFYDLGERHFGENKVQEMVDKWTAFPKDDLVWHMIGTIQTNKIKFLAERVNWIHSISKVKYLEELEKRLKIVNRQVNVLIQVNISDEDQKSGCEAQDLSDFFAFAKTCSHITVRGLMGIGSLENDAELNRPQFKELADLLAFHRNKWDSPQIQLTELSMGMTHDLEVAIQEGATMIRIGTALFGNRTYEI